MANVNPYTLLEKELNPLLVPVDKNKRPSADPLLAMADIRTVEGVQTPESALIDIYAFTSEPAIIIGDNRAYTNSPGHIKQGQIKAKYYTQEIIVTEDEYKRMLQNNGKATQMIKDRVEEQLKRNNEYFIAQLRKVAITGLSAAASGGTDEGDAKVIAALGSGDGGTLTDPYDLNAVAGTSLDLTSSVALSGGQQTTNNINAIMSQVRSGMVKIDVDTGMVLPIGKLYLGVDPVTNGVLQGTHDILDSTTGRQSEKPYAKMLEDQGVTIVEDYWFDTTPDLSEDDESILTFFGENVLRMYLIQSPDGSESWSPWESKRVIQGEKSVIQYETHKSHEIAMYAQPYWLRTTAGSDGAFYKKVFRVTVQNYDNVSD